jgi:hypothetical protein
VIRGDGKVGVGRFGFGVLLFLFCTALPVRGQLLEDLRSNYQSSRARLEAELKAFDVFEGTWQAVLDSVDAAKVRGDDSARDAAYLVAQTLAVTRGQRLGLQEEIRDILNISRDNLRAALEREISEMEAVYDTASVSTQENIDTLIESMEREIRALDRERELPQLTPVGRIQIDAIDRPEEIYFKAELLDRRADQYEQRLQDLDSQLTMLKRRLSRQRGRRDVRQQRDRFDDVRVPVGSTAQSGTDGANRGVSAADSLGIRQPQTLEEEIQVLESLRSDWISYRDQLRGQARSFRLRAGGRQ